ncbi:MAG: hypothetical protein AAB840_02520 [Patescibacteria group bacterium]
MTKKRSLMVKRVFNEILGQIKKGEKINVHEAALKVGYALTTARSQHFTKSQTWKECLALLDDRKILEEFRKIAMGSRDLRAKLEAGKEIFKLKDRYPAGKLKIGEYQEELESI